MFFNNPKQLKQVLPNNKCLMALDLGTKRIGVATSDKSGFIATPRFILKRRSNEKDFAIIKEFIVQNQIAGIVIGRPVAMDESPIAMTKFSEKFAEKFDEFLERKLPIIFFEERLTSFEARSVNLLPVHCKTLLRKKNKFIDDIAASLILQHFLDSPE
jgi:putative Holliday junction resolvase